MKIRELLEYGRCNLIDKEEPNRLSKMILKSLLKVDDIFLLINSEEEVTEDIQKQFKDNIELLNLGKPIQYIMHSQEFMKMNFYVDENVLIPQPDTEILVEEVINIFSGLSCAYTKDQNIRILDLCTGSGAIGISLAKYIKNSKVTMSDISENAVEIAKVVEKAGASLITVHGRTRAQGYSGKVDLDIIKKVKENVSIPVIGNGDIKSCYDAKYMIDYTKCDAVMIGRGILGNPWLIKECVDYLENGIPPKEVTIEEKFNMIKRHMDLLLSTKNEKVALLEMRTHIAYYLKGIPGTKELKQKIFKTKTKKEIIDLLDDFLKN